MVLGFVIVMSAKKKHPEAEALFKGGDVPSLADQARSDREADAQAGRDKTAKLRTQRLSRDAHLEAIAGIWTVHYFDNRLNRVQISREFTSEEGAMHQACDLMREGMRVDGVRGPEDRRIGEAELVAWCKRHRSPQTPDSSKRVR